MIYINLINSCEFCNLLFIISNGLSLYFKYNLNKNNISFINYPLTDLKKDKKVLGVLNGIGVKTPINHLTDN